jgi:two-component system chemotaxis sensor kinase CheA
VTTLLERFIPEAREHLQISAAGLLRLEREPGDDGLVNEVFRSVHTLKGASGLFDVPGLTRLLHAGEDLLGAVRANVLRLDSAMVDALLEGLDVVSAWVDALERQGRLPDDADGVSVELSRRLRALLPHTDEAMTTLVPVATEIPADWLGELPEQDRLAAFTETVAGGPPLLAVSYVPDEGCFYRGEDPFNLLVQLGDLKSLRISLRDPPVPLGETDPFRSTLAFRALSSQARGEVEYLLRYAIDQVTVTAIAPEALLFSGSKPDDESGDEDFVREARSYLEVRDFASLRLAIARHPALTGRQPWLASALRWLDAVSAAPLPNVAWAASVVDWIAEHRAGPVGTAATQERPVSSTEPAATPAQSASALSDGPMAGRILAGQLRILAMPGESETLERRMAAVQATVASLLASLGWSVRQGELEAATREAASGAPGQLQALITGLGKRVEAAAQGPAPAPPGAADLLAVNPDQKAAPEQRAAGETPQIAHVLKVDQAKIDALMNLIAELVVSKNSLPFLATRAEEIYGSREMGREIKDQYAVIDRLAQEMQRAIMDVRMLPVSEVFERFPRLVRDLARKLNKHIELRIVGEDTAADKTIIESLGDPLIHLVRNAIDHGIESPEKRLAAGKPEMATIQLRAFQEGDQVVIEVSDDGSGIDPMAIRLKAFEKGMVAEDKVDALSDQAAINLIFLPGFSTTDQISDLSGRGVGMDVVRDAVEKMHGQVSLSSAKGEGTMVRLSLPLSMAVARVMMVEVGGALFGVPMDGVAETVKVPRDRIRMIKRAEAFVLRDAIVPLVSMHTLLGLPRREVQVDEEAVLVARVGGAAVGLVVDRLRAGIDVVLKPLEGVLAGTRGYSGTALLGDGRVLLVLNLKELL